MSGALWSYTEYAAGGGLWPYKDLGELPKAAHRKQPSARSEEIDYHPCREGA